MHEFSFKQYICKYLVAQQSYCSSPKVQYFLKQYESRFGNNLQQCVCNAKYIALLSFRLEQMEKGNKCNFSFFREKTFYHYLFQWSKISIRSKVHLRNTYGCKIKLVRYFFKYFKVFIHSR